MTFRQNSCSDKFDITVTHPFYYPVDIFCEGMIKNFFMLSYLDEKAAYFWKERIEKMLPGYATQEGFQKAKGTIILMRENLETSSRSGNSERVFMLGHDNWFSRLKKLLHLKRQYNPELIVIFQEDIDKPADIFSNLVTFFLFQTKYKAKLDKNGANKFLNNRFESFVSRGINRLKGKMRHLIFKPPKKS